MRRQWALLPTVDEDLLRSVVAEIPIDVDVERLVAGLLRSGAEVTIVSDGFGFPATELGRSLGIPVATATVDWATGTLVFPHADLSCPCARCGTCKQSPLRQAAARGRTTVFVGDGTSDEKAAGLADVLFAKDALARWCDDHHVPYRPFSSLGHVAAALGLVP